MLLKGIAAIAVKIKIGAVGVSNDAFALCGDYTTVFLFVNSLSIFFSKTVAVYFFRFIEI